MSFLAQELVAYYVQTNTELDHLAIKASRRPRSRIQFYVRYSWSTEYRRLRGHARMMQYRKQVARNRTSRSESYDSDSFSIRRTTGGAEATYQLWRAAANFSDDDSYRTHPASSTRLNCSRCIVILNITACGFNYGFFGILAA